MVNKNSPVPIYYQLEEQIKTQIESGILQPGDMVMSERELTEKYEISRMTVRQAITNLVHSGYLYRVKGKGTFVTEPKLEQKLHGLTGFTEDMHTRGLTPSSKVISFSIIPAPLKLAKELELAEHDPIYEIKRIRLADGKPMALERTYLSANLVVGLTEDIVQQSLYQYVEGRIHLKMSSGTQEIEASTATKEEVKHLQVPTDSPLLLMRRKSFLEDGRVLEVVQSTYRADRYKFMIRLDRGSF
ncbi:GntR family transcriptional regulator [Radiobacillus kanasensis]|uniref:GntR family transcriptional regulator n=1 Tax=Radiobacillus kanasensis TaxID=2844358 RepID=UPI001E2E4433|nr:GntR family transcriptional regulator [Radiobacillus kanasensis]UFU00797.1 GntR family transcriptional regulator [Radiobacillus kanasensis]